MENDDTWTELLCKDLLYLRTRKFPLYLFMDTKGSQYFNWILLSYGWILLNIETMLKILHYLITLKLLLSNIRFSALFRHLEEFTLWFWQTTDLKSVIYVPNISLVEKHHKSTTLVCTILNHVSVENSINHSSQRYANLYIYKNSNSSGSLWRGLNDVPWEVL